MGYLLASGNQIIWIRPSFQDAQAHAIEIGKRIKKGIPGKEAAKWGDEGKPPETASWFSVAFDPDNAFWIVRQNPKVCMEVMKAITGGTKWSGPDLELYSNAYKGGGEPAVVLMSYQFTGQGAPTFHGNGGRGGVFETTGVIFHGEKLKGYRMRTRYVRQLDASIMTPDERLCEMTQCAIEDPQFTKKMKDQFGALANPVVLFQLAMVIGVFIGIGAGAQAIGGAAFAAALMRLVGVAFTAHQVGGYVTQFQIVQKACFSDKQGDFSSGIQAIQQILVMAVTDIAMFVTMEGAMKIGTKAIALFKKLITEYAPAKWLKAAEEMKGAAQHKAAQARAKVYGFMSENLLKHVPDPMKLFRKAEYDFYLARASKNKEMVVVRGPSAERIDWLTKLRGWMEGKAEWIKAKSWMGWKVNGRATGLVGVPKAALNEAMSKVGLKLTPMSPYPMGNLKGVFKEVDDYVDSLAGAARNNHSYAATRPSYDLPRGVEIKVDVPGKGEMKVFDWKAAGANHADCQGYRLVDVGDTYIVVDSLGRPVCQDLDIGVMQKMGTPAGDLPGSHLPSGRGNPEDNYIAQEMANWQMGQADGYMYGPSKHGGAGGSMRHSAEGAKAKKPHWTPKQKDGSYDAEDLYIFLPVAGGGSKMFKLDGWKQFEEFWKANQALIGSPWPY